jgi:hypothetical protein
MKRVIDLDAAKAARAEAKQEAPVIKFNGAEYTLPIELPWRVVEAASSSDTVQIINAVKSLLGDQWEDFEKNNISAADMLLLIENIAKIYAVEPGN